MPGRHRLTALVVYEPENARAQLRKAFVDGKASRIAASKILGCGRATFVEWCRVVGLDLDELERIAKKEGWYIERGGRPRGSVSKSAALK